MTERPISTGSQVEPLVTSIESQSDRRLLFDHPDPYLLVAMLRQAPRPRLVGAM
jgi:hypothetical protein